MMTVKNDESFKKEYRKTLDTFSSVILKAYLDSIIFLSIVPLANDKHKTSNFLFDYSFYTIRERTIISAKSLMEKKGSNKISLEKVIKDLQQNEKFKSVADDLHSKYIELFSSEEAKRVKEFRDSLCHNIENCDGIKIYCDDLMTIIDGAMKIVNEIYKLVYNSSNEDFYKISFISKTLADDYWGAICHQADRMPKRYEELAELQRMINC